MVAEIARLFPSGQGEALALVAPKERDAALAEAIRIAEALLFAASEPLSEGDIEKRMPRGVSVSAALVELQADYSARGVNLARVGGKWMFRTAADLAWLLAAGEGEPKKLSRAALETLAIVAYHQPVTRAEIEDIRGVAISKGTLDVLLETGWVRLRGRRRAPGRPITYGTTQGFLVQFGLDAITDLPGLEELKGAGLFDGRLPTDLRIPQPSDAEELAADEDPLTDEPADAPAAALSTTLEASEAAAPADDAALSSDEDQPSDG
ncbi:SMC-Scp complex subunit ScpB [Methylocapsa acidiphila]|uniref:SMC-Scp complex subunit ScpB n=1 Tax=Methylocapsa acidiphila TaxID=133552 RepID=UPI00068681DE|nr:SMC-Scp complex subunit ScpB [Methylocapsa acidiphila]